MKIFDSAKNRDCTCPKDIPPPLTKLSLSLSLSPAILPQTPAPHPPPTPTPPPPMALGDRSNLAGVQLLPSEDGRHENTGGERACLRNSLSRSLSLEEGRPVIEGDAQGVRREGEGGRAVEEEEDDCGREKEWEDVMSGNMQVSLSLSLFLSRANAVGVGLAVTASSRSNGPIPKTAVRQRGAEGRGFVGRGEGRGPVRSGGGRQY